MKVYQDLTIRGSKQSLHEFISALDLHLIAGWTRRQEREAEVNMYATGKMYCFACTARAGRPESELWIATNRDGNLYVSNIVAKEHSSLSHDQYNSILADFDKKCIQPAAAVSSVDVELGQTDVRLDEYFSAGTIDLLRSFSANANKSALHPYDRSRWNRFLVAAHREGGARAFPMLERWLIEEENWPGDQAAKLAAAYEDADALLDVYESQPA
jgi:hypothetical protein